MQTGPFSKEEKQFIYDNYSVKGAEWCAIKLKRSLLSIQVYSAKRRMNILDGKSDEIYLRYVAPKKIEHDIRRSWPYE